MTPGMAIAGATAWTSPSEAGVAIAVPPSFGGGSIGPQDIPDCQSGGGATIHRSPARRAAKPDPDHLRLDAGMGMLENQN